LEHRPWALPERAWTWQQSWLDLLFAHWPVDASALRPLVPKGLELQEREGACWIGIVPFRMAGVMRRHRAAMSIEETASGFQYRSARPGAEFRATYAPTSRRP
jgi:uncharacterized protein YqjF (DUF2071 family)